MTTANEIIAQYHAFGGVLGALAHMSRDGGPLASRSLEVGDLASFAAKLKLDWPAEIMGAPADGDPGRVAELCRELGSMPGVREDWRLPARHFVARYEGRLPVTIPPVEAPSAPSATSRITFTDELVYAGSGGGSNRHRPKLLLQRGEETRLFEGASIPGWVRVDSERATKNGKWSYTTWDLTVAANTIAWTNAGGTIRPLNVNAGPSVAYESATRWADVTVPETVMRSLASLAARRLDLNELEV